MRACTFFLAAAAAAVVLSLGVSAASATRLGLTSKEFEAAWAQLRFEAGELVAECLVSLAGSFFSARIQKVANAQVGAFYGGAVTHSVCFRGQATIVEETLPWPIKYSSFTGTLPQIGSIVMNVTGLSFDFEVGLGFKCLIRTEAVYPGRGVFTLQRGGEISLFGFEPRARIPLTSGGGLGCPASEGSLSESAVVRLEGNTNAITVVLI